MPSILSALIVAYSIQISGGHSEYLLWESHDIDYSKMTQVTTDIKTKMSLHGVYVGGSIKTSSISQEKTYFKPGGYNPLQNSYGFNAGYQYKCFDVGYRHTCEHPSTNYTFNSPKRKYEGSYWQLFIKFETSVTPFK